MVARLAAFLLAAAVQTVSGAGVIEIVSELKTFRSGFLDILSDTSASLEKASLATEAKAVAKFSDDWLSILGVSRGLTGLAKDFVMNHLGRSTYHDSNGPLIEALKRTAESIPAKMSSLSDNEMKGIRHNLLDVCSEGKSLFQKDGALHSLVTEFKGILDGKDAFAHLAKAAKVRFQENPDLRHALFFLAGTHKDTKLFVGKLPLDVTKEQIRKVFEVHGQVLDVHILSPERGGEESQRTAIVTYAESRMADTAVQKLDNAYRFSANAPEPIAVSIAHPDKDDVARGGANEEL